MLLSGEFMNKKVKKNNLKSSKSKNLFDFLEQKTTKICAVVISLIFVLVSIINSIIICIEGNSGGLGISIYALLIPSIVFLIYFLNNPFKSQKNVLLKSVNILSIIIFCLFFIFGGTIMFTDLSLIVESIVSLIIILLFIICLISIIFKLNIITIKQTFYILLMLIILDLIKIIVINCWFNI
jgi:hypothetical protein